ncbi:MAG: hypothetical protein QNJ51_02755 [Calothrix sp. MO_167.B12]|nr:hypothetical protein [Calothrix sp. MO_167.B12]
MKSTLKYSVRSILPILILTSLVSGIGELSFSNRATAETVAPPTSTSEITLPEAIKMVRGHASKHYGVSRKRWRCRDFYYDRRDPTRPRRRPRRIQQDCRATVEVTPKTFGWVMVVSGIKREPTYDRGYSHVKITYHVTKSGRLTVVDP